MLVFLSPAEMMSPRCHDGHPSTTDGIEVGIARDDYWH